MAGETNTDALQGAVETVVDYLDTHGHQELARQVALATDPMGAAERLEYVALLRVMLGLTPGDPAKSG